MWARTKEEKRRLKQVAIVKIRHAIAELDDATRVLVDDEPQLAVALRRSVVLIKNILDSLR